MADELESDLGAEETPSTTQAASPSIDYRALAEALTPTIEEIVQRKTKSAKDKRIGRLEGTVRDVLAEMKRLRDKGFTEAQAEEILNRTSLRPVIDEDEDDQPSATPAAGVSTPPPPPAAAPKKEADPSVFGLNPNDPEVAELVRQGKNTPDDFYEYISKKKAAAPPASPAAVQPQPGGGAPKEDLQAEYKSKIEEVRKNPLGSKDQILAIRAEYRKKGLQI